MAIITVVIIAIVVIKAVKVYYILNGYLTSCKLDNTARIVKGILSDIRSSRLLLYLVKERG